MSVFSWITRRAPGISVVGLIILAWWVCSREFVLDEVLDHLPQTLHHRSNIHAPPPTADAHARAQNGGNWTIFFAYYALFIHICVTCFPFRASWAVLDLTRSLKKVLQNKPQQDLKYLRNRRLSSTSLSSADTLTSQSSSASSEAGDNELGCIDNAEVDHERVIHAILIPNYKEELDGLRETLDVLACHPQARSQYDVYLAMEAREPGVELKALGLVSEYMKKFRFIDFTLHPSDIPGEAGGKGSNMAWAARKASERYSGSQRKDVIITGIDADSHLSSNFFSLITNMHLLHPETANTTLYSAPIIFDRNAHLVPALVRVADVVWCAAGLSGLYQGSSIRPPTSVYSVPMELADRVGGWDVDSEAIGEDLHMYLKCFFALNGHLTSRTVLAPVSQSNVSDGAGKGVWGTITCCQARYKQAMRHMWGALDSGYAMRKFVEMWIARKSTGRAFRPMHNSSDSGDVYVPEPNFDTLEEQKPIENGVFSDVVQDTLKSPDYLRFVYLFHRLLEAHFLTTHMAVLVISTSIYMFLTQGKPDPLGVAWIFRACNVLRIVGFAAVPFWMLTYEGYHQVCAEAREQDMKNAGLASGMTFSYRSFRTNWYDYLMVPIVAPVYGSIPSIVAQICHFWTVDLVYVTSSKPLRQRAKSLVQEVKAGRLRAKSLVKEVLGA